MTRGYFEVGIFQPKTEENIGTLWRSAYQLGAAGIFTIGRRYKEQSSDTCKAWRHIPLRHYADFNDFQEHRAYSVPLIAVEFGGIAVEQFTHPERGIYLLGSEDNGLPNSVTQSAQFHIALSTERTLSFNVAVAGSIVMYDRLVKG